MVTSHDPNFTYSGQVDPNEQKFITIEELGDFKVSPSSKKFVDLLPAQQKAVRKLKGQSKFTPYKKAIYKRGPRKKGRYTCTCPRSMWIDPTPTCPNACLYCFVAPLMSLSGEPRPRGAIDVNQVINALRGPHGKKKQAAYVDVIKSIGVVRFNSMSDIRPEFSPDVVKLINALTEYDIRIVFITKMIGHLPDFLIEALAANNASVQVSMAFSGDTVMKKFWEPSDRVSIRSRKRGAKKALKIFEDSGSDGDVVLRAAPLKPEMNISDAASNMKWFAGIGGKKVIIEFLRCATTKKHVIGLAEKMAQDFNEPRLHAKDINARSAAAYAAIPWTHDYLGHYFEVGEANQWTVRPEFAYPAYDYLTHLGNSLEQQVSICADLEAHIRFSKLYGWTFDCCQVEQWDTPTCYAGGDTTRVLKSGSNAKTALFSEFAFTDDILEDLNMCSKYGRGRR
tara:strand:+ start:750 stop:2105 length:1356 start_codon:yes stop_codon:yes gene_type:complete